MEILPAMSMCDLNKIIKGHTSVLICLIPLWCKTSKSLNRTLEAVTEEFPSLKVVNINVQLEDEICRHFPIKSNVSLTLFHNTEKKLQFLSSSNYSYILPSLKKALNF